MGNVLVHKDYGNNELRNARIQPVATDPTGLGAGNSGRTWFNTAEGRYKVWNGSGTDLLTNLIEAVSAADSAVTAVLAGKTVTVGVAAASGSQRGTQSTTHYSAVEGATDANTASALVKRDASGNFVANVVTANLNGTAGNASALGGATLAQVRDFSQTTGTRLRTAISDFDAGVQALRWASMLAPNAHVSMGSYKLINLADPQGAQDAATKNYVDNVATGLDTKASVKYATAAALAAYGATATVLTASANGALTIDGQSPAAGDRVLVKNESGAPQNNGIYVVTNAGSGSAAWVLTRASDADTSAEVSGGMFTFVEAGSTNTTTTWVLTGTGAFTIGTTAQNFSQFGGGSTYLNGNGLDLTGNVFSVKGTNNRIAVSSSGVDIASTYVGQTSLTTLGTVTTGVWNASTIGLGYGGTGATTAAGAKTNLGFANGNAADIPAGTSYTWTHSLGTADLVVMVIEKASGNVVEVDITGITSTQLVVSFAQAVAANAYRVIAIGR